MKIFIVIAALLFCSPILAQETGIQPNSEQGKLMEMLKECMERQDVVASEQRLLRENLGDIRQKIIQLNFNILSWQTAQQQAAAGSHLSRVFTQFGDKPIYFVVGLAIFGFLSIFYFIIRFLQFLGRKLNGSGV